MAIIALIVFGAIALFVVGIFWDYSARQDRAKRMESQFGTEQVLRAREKTRLLLQIGRPECPDGTYSPNQLALWRKYRDLDDWDRAMTSWEINQIVETRGYS